MWNPLLEISPPSKQMKIILVSIVQYENFLTEMLTNILSFRNELGPNPKLSESYSSAQSRSGESKVQ